MVTDSTAYLPVAVVEQHRIEVIPLHVVVGGRELVEGRDISAAQVAAALREYTIVSTSRPSPAMFAEVYARLVDEGATHIVSVHLSSQMSGTHEAASLAATEASVPVEVIDSETIGMAMGFSVVAGAKVANAGGEVDAVTEAIRERLGPSGVLFYVDTLEHLRRGGASGPRRRCSGPPSRSSRSWRFAAGGSCRSRRSGPRHVPWLASRPWCSTTSPRAA